MPSRVGRGWWRYHQPAQGTILFFAAHLRLIYLCPCSCQHFYLQRRLRIDRRLRSPHYIVYKFSCTPTHTIQSSSSSCHLAVVAPPPAVVHRCFRLILHCTPDCRVITRLRWVRLPISVIKNGFFTVLLLSVGCSVDYTFSPNPRIRARMCEDRVADVTLDSFHVQIVRQFHIYSSSQTESAVQVCRNLSRSARDIADSRSNINMYLVVIEYN